MTKRPSPPFGRLKPRRSAAPPLASGSVPGRAGSDRGHPFFPLDSCFGPAGYSTWSRGGGLYCSAGAGLGRSGEVRWGCAAAGSRIVARPPKANSYHLVASHRHGGTFVTDILLDEMRVIFELRAAAEAFAVREAARVADKETLKLPIASVDTQVGRFIHRAGSPPGKRTTRDPRAAPGAARSRGGKYASAVHEARSRQTAVGSAHRRAARGEP